MFTRACHWFVFWARLFESTPSTLFLSDPLSAHIHLDLPNGVFPSGFPVCTSHLSYACHMPVQSHSPWFDHSNNVWWTAQIMKLLIMHFFQLSVIFSLLVKIFSSSLCSQTPLKFYIHTKQQVKFPVNFIPVIPLVTPVYMQPEWYFLCAYAVLCIF
jgi:quinol-cytochrome oxidoreductase complex cytochrome b subunit